MPQYMRRVDKNQTEVVRDLRRMKGLTVTPLSQVGHGVPDLLVGYAGVNFLIELKSTEKLWLTEDEQKWHDKWTGQVEICTSAEQVVKLIHRTLCGHGRPNQANELRTQWEKKHG